MDLWKSIRHKFQVAGQLSLRDWLGLAGAWWVLLGFFLALRRVSLDRLETFTRPTPIKMADQPGAITWAWQRQKWISMAAGLHLYPMTCLPRAISLRWMLSRHAIPSQLCIGITRNLEAMHAHAWVEVAGEPIGEAEDITEKFKVLQGTA